MLSTSVELQVNVLGIDSPAYHRVFISASLRPTCFSKICISPPFFKYSSRSLYPSGVNEWDNLISSLKLFNFCITFLAAVRPGLSLSNNKHTLSVYLDNMINCLSE